MAQFFQNFSATFFLISAKIFLIYFSGFSLAICLEYFTTVTYLWNPLPVSLKIPQKYLLINSSMISQAVLRFATFVLRLSWIVYFSLFTRFSAWFISVLQSFLYKLLLLQFRHLIFVLAILLRTSNVYVNCFRNFSGNVLRIFHAIISKPFENNYFGYFSQVLAGTSGNFLETHLKETPQTISSENSPGITLGIRRFSKSISSNFGFTQEFLLGFICGYFFSGFSSEILLLVTCCFFESFSGIFFLCNFTKKFSDAFFNN